MNRNHVITIDQEVELMTIRMQESPKLLHEGAGNESCCIFRVPQSLLQINEEAFRPLIVSIGPYHHGSKAVEMIEEHKWRYLNKVITRTGKSLGSFMHTIVSMEDDIRQTYSLSLDGFATKDLAKMMVLDGFFLIEFFRKVGKVVRRHPDEPPDPFFKLVWMNHFLLRDLLKLENQIPFFVLQKLFDESRTGDCTLQSLIFGYFNHFFHRPKEVLLEYENLEGKHLLDLVRKSFINTKKKKHIVSNPNKILHTDPFPEFIQPATKLKIAGVKFKVNHEAHSLLDIEFRKGTLLIPQIKLEEFYVVLILNCVAFEQSYYYCSRDFTAYFMFMGDLMTTSIDVALLSKCRIIQNDFGPDEEIVKFFYTSSKHIAFDATKSYLMDLFIELDEYRNGWNVSLDQIKHTYFPSRWALISVFAAVMLLSLATLQTIYTVYPYYHPN